MSRTPDESILSHLNPEDSDLLYKPSDREREAKARYWTRREEDMFSGADVLSTKAACERLSGIKLAKWGAPGFQDWFLNRDEHRHKLEYIFGLCLDASIEILKNQDPKVQSARVNLIRVMSELAGKVPHKQANIRIEAATAQSSRINGMDQAQLEQYLEAQKEIIEVLPIAERPKD